MPYTLTKIMKIFIGTNNEIIELGIDANRTDNQTLLAYVLDKKSISKQWGLVELDVIKK